MALRLSGRGQSESQKETLTRVHPEDGGRVGALRGVAGQSHALALLKLLLQGLRLHQEGLTCNTQQRIVTVATATILSSLLSAPSSLCPAEVSVCCYTQEMSQQ